MVEIVGIDEKAKKKITHKECGAILLYLPNEVVTLWSGTDYGGGPDGATGFKCPHCGGNVIIERW